MNHVSLICTVHGEIERANVAGLHAILARVQPDVIFLEVPEASFSEYYVACSEHNLESRAVNQYRSGRPVRLVPVDLPTPEREFFEDHEHLHNRVLEESFQYRQLLMTNHARIQKYGFAYLNSDFCDKHWLDTYGEMLAVVRRLGDPRLLSIYDCVVRKLEARDAEMISRILNFCKSSVFEKGAFLVGAEHRRRIVELAKEQLSASPASIQWDWKVET
jgi:hypothetical protein